jgi:hypothetical protein
MLNLLKEKYLWIKDYVVYTYWYYAAAGEHESTSEIFKRIMKKTTNILKKKYLFIKNLITKTFIKVKQFLVLKDQNDPLNQGVELKKSRRLFLFSDLCGVICIISGFLLVGYFNRQTDIIYEPPGWFTIPKSVHWSDVCIGSLLLSSILIYIIRQLAEYIKNHPHWTEKTKKRAQYLIIAFNLLAASFSWPLIRSFIAYYKGKEILFKNFWLGTLRRRLTKKERKDFVEAIVKNFLKNLKVSWKIESGLKKWARDNAEFFFEKYDAGSVCGNKYVLEVLENRKKFEIWLDQASKAAKAAKDESWLYDEFMRVITLLNPWQTADLGACFNAWIFVIGSVTVIVAGVWGIGLIWDFVKGGVVPGAVVPSAVVPSAVVPGGVLPGGILPSAVVPGGVLPGGVLPGGILPSAVVPGGVLPGAVVPGAVLPGGILPGGDALNWVLPGGGASCGAGGLTIGPGLVIVLAELAGIRSHEAVAVAVSDDDKRKLEEAIRTARRIVEKELEATRSREMLEEEATIFEDISDHDSIVIPGDSYYNTETTFVRLEVRNNMEVILISPRGPHERRINFPFHPNWTPESGTWSPLMWYRGIEPRANLTLAEWIQGITNMPMDRILEDFEAAHIQAERIMNEDRRQRYEERYQESVAQFYAMRELIRTRQVTAPLVPNNTHAVVHLCRYLWRYFWS